MSIRSWTGESRRIGEPSPVLNLFLFQSKKEGRQSRPKVRRELKGRKRPWNAAWISYSRSLPWARRPRSQQPTQPFRGYRMPWRRTACFVC